MSNTKKLRERLIKKLTELYLLDQPDLDFGFYRIMQTKALQIKNFIDKDLLKIIEDAFGQIDEADVYDHLYRFFERYYARESEFHFVVDQIPTTSLGNY